MTAPDVAGWNLGLLRGPREAGIALAVLALVHDATSLDRVGWLLDQ